MLFFSFFVYIFVVQLKNKIMIEIRNIDTKDD